MGAKEELKDIMNKVNDVPKAQAVFVTNIAGKDVDWEQTFQFNLEGEEPFYLEVSEQKGVIKDGEASDPDIIMTGDPNSIIKICKGQGDFTHAISREEITVEKGKVMDVIRLTRAITAALKA